MGGVIPRVKFKTNQGNERTYAHVLAGDSATAVHTLSESIGYKMATVPIRERRSDKVKT